MPAPSAQMKRSGFPMRVYAIGDIHGHTDKLHEAHALIAADRTTVGDQAAPVVHIGDVVAKGPDSRGSIEVLMQGQARGEPWIVLKGNHERMLSVFLDDPFARDPGQRSSGLWGERRTSGGVVLGSYGIHDIEGLPMDELHAEAMRVIPQAHRDWLGALPAWHLTPSALFVHAGVRPGIDLQMQSETDLIWIRKSFQRDPRDHGVLVVHGHTPGKRVQHFGNRINIDTGAAKGGPVSAIVLDADGAYVLTKSGREPLEP